MNPLEAVDAVAGGRGPLATLQALNDALAALAPLGPGLAEESAAPHGETVPPLGLADEGVTPVAPAAETPSAQVTQATQGRLTLGQLATEQAALRSAPEQSSALAARDAEQAAPRADGGSPAPHLADAVVVPVLLTPLQPPAPPPVRAPDAQQPERRRGERDEREPAPPEPETALDADTAPGQTPAEDAADPEAVRLRALLEGAGQAEALAELARGRRVLLVLPQAGAERGVADATAWLAGAARAQRFGARWWPGGAAAAGAGWLQWRVFRDGDPLLGRGLASRSGGSACRVRLGAGALRLADAASALLDIGDRIRFAQALGGQWSVLVVAAPVGTAA